MKHTRKVAVIALEFSQQESTELSSETAPYWVMGIAKQQETSSRSRMPPLILPLNHQEQEQEQEKEEEEKEIQHFGASKPPQAFIPLFLPPLSSLNKITVIPTNQIDQIELKGKNKIA